MQQKKSTSLAGLNSERIQTTDIQDFENSDDTTDNQNIKDQVASTDDGIMDESPGGHESAPQKAKETVSDNRGVQLGLIIGGIVLAGNCDSDYCIKKEWVKKKYRLLPKKKRNLIP